MKYAGYIIFIALSMCLTSCDSSDKTQNTKALMSHLEEEGLVMLWTSFEDDGSVIHYSTTEDVISHVPEWDGISEPPLSIPKAIQLAQGHLKQDQLTLSSVSANKVPSFKNPNRWQYILSFHTEPTDGSYPISHTVCMLMNGTIIEAKTIK